MMQNNQCNSEYKKDIIASFDIRKLYDNEYTINRANLLLEKAGLNEGQTVLDVATGTGLVAIAAASIIGSNGKIIGFDISRSMLNQAMKKIQEIGLRNITLIEADADFFHVKPESIDAILCSSSIMWFKDISITLNNWKRWLKNNGSISFSCYSENSFMIPVISRVFLEHGIELLNCNKPLGTPERCNKYLTDAGFSNAAISTAQFGKFISVKKAKNSWKGDDNWLHPAGNPLKRLSNKDRTALKKAYDHEIETLTTEKGVWNEITMFFVKATKE